MSSLWIISMNDRVEIVNKQDTDLKEQLEKVDWPIEYGTITVQVRNGQPSLLKIERTVKLD